MAAVSAPVFRTSHANSCPCRPLAPFETRQGALGLRWGAEALAPVDGHDSYGLLEALEFFKARPGDAEGMIEPSKSLAAD